MVNILSGRLISEMAEMSPNVFVLRRSDGINNKQNIFLPAGADLSASSQFCRKMNEFNKTPEKLRPSGGKQGGR